MKKRFLAIVLTLVMALALAVPSFAATMPTTYIGHDALLVDEVPGSIYDSVIHQNWVNTNRTLVKVTHKNAYWGYMNIYGNPVAQLKYTQIGNYSAEGLAWAMKNDVACYVNAAGTEVISVGVATPHDFSNGLARIVEHHNNTYFIDTTGKVVFNLGAETAGEFDANGRTWVKSSLTGKYGMINKLGQEVAHFRYDKVSMVGTRLNFQSGLLRAERDGLVVFLDVNGNEKIVINMAQQGLSYVDDFSNGMCLLKDLHGQVGYMDVTGWVAAYCQYEEGLPFNGMGIARIKRNGKYGYIDMLNRYRVQPVYDYLDAVISDGMIVAGKLIDNMNITPGWNYSTIQNGNVDEWHVNDVRPYTGSYALFGYVNATTGLEQIPVQYHTAHRFSEQYAQVSKYSVKGFVDLYGNVKIYDTFYDELGDFHSGLAWAMKNGKYGYINKLGQVAITAKFDDPMDRDPYDFQGTMALARMGTTNPIQYANRYGIIDTAGNWLYNPTFSDVIYFNPVVDQVALFYYGGVANAIVLLTR